jgi:ComF family protein
VFTSFGYFFTRLADWLFPPVCLHCQREGTWLCSAGCDEFTKIKFLVDPVAIPGVEKVLCVGSYDHPLLAKLITGIKYHSWFAYQVIIPTLIKRLGPLSGSASIFTVVPIPLHNRRRRWRGFNQAELIAEALADQYQLPIALILQRFRYTDAQAKLRAKDRDRNISQAFRIKIGLENIPENVILVDDVVTTGSTVRECASVLKQAGVKRIIVVALAKG